MEKRFENKLTMIKAVVSLLTQNQTIWQDSVPQVAAINDLKTLITKIELAQQNIQTAGSGLVTEKQTQQETLIENSFELASMLFAFAQRTGDQVLKSKVDFPISVLKNQRDGELAVSCKNILNLGTSQQAALVEYGITPEKLSSLQNLINQYEIQLPAHRVIVSERKATNEKMKGLFADALGIIANQIDRMMVRYKGALPDFYASYQNARKILDYGIRHEKTETPASPEQAS
ncbi:MAG: hypothetical protein WAO52_07315 [Prolixibacteraceae bacterium]